jgi:PAS domain S-box-containing protein
MIAPPRRPKNAEAPQSLALRLASEMGLIGVWRHELRTGLVSCDERTRAALGLPASEQPLALRALEACLNPQDLPALQASARRTLMSGEPSDARVRYRAPSGAWRHALIRRSLESSPKGRPLAFVGVVMDITEQVREQLAEQKRAEKLQARLEMAASSAGIGLWSREANESFRGTWNRQMFELMGRDPELGTPTREEWIEQIIHADDRARMRAFQRDLLSGTEQTLELEFRIHRGDGQIRWLFNRARQELVGADTMILGVTLDITERMHAESARREQALAQRESQAKSMFLARMSHELRTPLNAILGFTQLLHDQELQGRRAPDAQRLLRLDHIRSAGEHLLSLINDALDLSAMDADQLPLNSTAVPVGQAFSAALPMVQRAAQEARVRLHTQASAVVAWCDPLRLRQVLINLLSNAVKYNRPNGAVLLDATALGSEVRIRVQDTGLGMAPEQLAHVFEPFNRLGAELSGIEGHGIGLAIAHGLVKRMSGRMEVHSQLGEGSCFEIYLPLAHHYAPPKPKEQAPASPALPSLPSAPRRHLLYIEDNPINVLVVEELVRSRTGYDITSVASVQEGLQRAKQLLPDLVLLDMQLPDGLGTDVLQALKQDPSTSHIPCVALSANTHPADIEAALQAGFKAYWTKPIEFSRFVADLEALLAPLEASGTSQAAH